MSKPLDGIRVIDFGQYLAGPLVALLLADNGADVIRVDPPGGPRWQHATNAMLQRGKRSIVLNLKDEDDRAVARRLVGSADVVIENFRPGVMERLGLGAAATMEANPALIYCSIPGFPSTDPRAHLADWESVVSAAAGLYYPPRLTKLGASPVYNAVPFASSFTAFIASHSIVAALMARQRTDRGERIEVSLFDAAFEAMGNQAQMIDGKPVPVNPVPTDGSPANSRVMGGRHRCGDVGWVDISPPLRGQSWFLDHFMPQEAKDAGVASMTNTDPDAVAQLRSLVAATFQSHSAAAWESLANTVAGTGLALCQSTQQWFHDQHTLDTRCVIALHDPEFGSTAQAGYPISLSKTPPETREPRQRLDADHAEILKELKEQEGQPRAATGLASDAQAVRALQGIRVLDLTQVLAGPTAARVLAEYGADVIKINNPRPDRNPHGSRAHTCVNNGKRTVLLDLKSPEDLAALRQLIKGADVFHQHLIVGAADRLGFGEAAVHALQPEIIYSSVNTHAYGGFRSGWRGHEELSQAVTGMEVRLGGDGEPARCGWAPCDYSTGHLSAFGMMLALYHYLRTGEGQHVRASLSGSATFLQVPFMIDCDGSGLGRTARPPGARLGPARPSVPGERPVALRHGGG